MSTHQHEMSTHQHELSTHQHEMSTQANKDETIDCVDFPPLPHPLRILSEENLTIVSSFAGSLNELPNSDDEKVDASKLSFFQVPDFAAIDGNENDRIMQTFKDFEELQNNKNNEETSYEDPRFKQDISEKLHTFSSKTEINQQLISSVPSPQISIQQQKQQLKSELITPQKQFLLLSQSLRHPDGSSNPELNIMNIAEQQLPPQQRSPGNGRSSSDMENDNKIDNYCPDTTQESTTVEVAATSPNNNSVITEMVVPIENSSSEKPTNKFGFRFLRFFGSTRSKKTNNSNNQHGRRAKSVDRKLEKVRNNSMSGIKEVKSSSSSPMVGTKIMSTPPSSSGNLEDPAMLSISTEWEFEPQEDEKNGNNDSSGTKHTSTLFENILIQKKLISAGKISKDRKSSGYDSLGGDESSSMDSNEHPVVVGAVQGSHGLQSKNPGIETPPQSNSSSNKPIRLSREMNNSLAKAFFAAKRQPMIHPEIQPQYSMPNDFYGQIANHRSSSTSSTGLNIMQYDELDILRMEQRQKNPAF